MPLAAPVIKAVLPALKTGCSGMVGLELMGLVLRRGQIRQWLELGANSVGGGDDSFS